MRLSLGLLLCIALLPGCNRPGGGSNHDESSELPVASDSLNVAPRDRSCVAVADTFGVAHVTVAEHADREWSVDAYFGVGADGAFYLTLSAQETGHLHIEFETPGRSSYPVVGTHVVVPRGVPADTASRSFRGQLELLFSEQSKHTTRVYSPVSGEVTIKTSEPAGICGQFDITWSEAGDTANATRGIRTTGVFQAVQNTYTAVPTRS